MIFSRLFGNALLLMQNLVPWILGIFAEDLKTINATHKSGEKFNDNLRSFNVKASLNIAKFAGKVPLISLKWYP